MSSLNDHSLNGPLNDHFENLSLIVVTGKGGTGKSVVSAALGRHLAERGRRTLLLEVDPRENLHHLCDVPPSGGDIVDVAPKLYLQNLKPTDVCDWVVEKQVKIKPIVNRVLKSPVYQRFVEGAPGITEIAILGHALRLVRGDRPDAPKIDTVILDAPATGHGIYLLTSSRLFGETVGEGPFADLALEVADFVDAPEKTGMVVVTLAEEMPVQEAIELVRDFESKLGRPPDLMVANALYPPVTQGPEQDDELTELWRSRRAVNEKELTRLAEHWPGPALPLPLLALDDGPRLVRALTDLIAEDFAAEESPTL